MDYDNACAVVDCHPEALTSQAKEARQLWHDREKLLVDHRASLTALWKFVFEVQQRKKAPAKSSEDDEDTIQAEEDQIQDLTERVQGFDAKLKECNRKLSQKINFHEDEHSSHKTCPLLLSCWHPSQFYKDPLNFESVTLKVNLNPGSEPVSFEIGAQLYYDQYFEHLTTFSIPSVESFALHKSSKEVNSKQQRPKGKKKSGGQKNFVRNKVSASDRSCEPLQETKNQTPASITSETDFKQTNGACYGKNFSKASCGPYTDCGKGKLPNQHEAITFEEAKAMRDLHHIPDEDLDPKISFDVIADRKGKRANEIVATVLEKWGVESELKMMILTEMKFSDHNAKTNLTNYNGDFDVFAISQQLGVIFIQVKGVQGKQDSSDVPTYSQNQRKKIGKAWEQVLKDVAFLRESNRDLPFMLDVPINTFVAVPNLSENDLTELGICKFHKQVILCQSDLEDITSFSSWMSSRLPLVKGQANVLSNEQYRRICSRYLALVAKVKFPSRSVTIEKTRGLVSAVKYGESGKLWAMLTPEQLNAVFDQERLKLVKGEFGTGKSLVLVMKAKQLATAKSSGRQCFVYLVTFAGVGTDVNCYHNTMCFSTTQLRQLMGNTPENVKLCQVSDILKEYDKSYYRETGEWTTITPSLLTTVFEWMSRKHDGKDVHFLFDEVPCYMFESCRDVFKEFPINHPRSCLWLVLATHSHKPTQFKLDDTQWLKDMKKAGFSVSPLMSSMRIPGEVFQMVQIIRGNEDAESAKKQRCGHVVPGPKPLVFILPECRCEDNDRALLNCGCVASRMEATFAKIFNVLDHTGKAIKAESFSIVVGCFVGTIFQNDICKLMWKAFKSIGKELKFNLTKASQEKLPVAKSEDSYCVYDRYTYIGCENTIIIDVDPYALHQCGANNQWTYSTMPFTRTVSQYVLFTWPKMEARAMWTKDLDGHDALTDKRVEMGQITKELRDIRYDMTGRARLSRGECLDKLIQSHAVINHPITWIDVEKFVTKNEAKQLENESEE